MRGIFFYDSALDATDDAGGKIIDDSVIMGSQQYGGIVGRRQLAQELKDIIGGVGVEVAGGFIGNEERRMVE